MIQKPESCPRERPILFSGEMVRAILEGRKTQTRRVVKPQPTLHRNSAPGFLCEDVWNWPKAHQFGTYATPDVLVREMLAMSPYGHPGERLWVREAFAIECECEGNRPPHSDGRPTRLTVADEYGTPEWEQPHYRATDEMPDLSCGHERCECGPCDKPWSPSIHMPRWASRIVLEITGVRVERVKEISEKDAMEEGAGIYLPRFEEWDGDPDQYRKCFSVLWEEINGKRGYGWQQNPWVWVLEFRRITL